LNVSQVSIQQFQVLLHVTCVLEVIFALLLTPSPSVAPQDTSRHQVC